MHILRVGMQKLARNADVWLKCWDLTVSCLFWRDVVVCLSFTNFCDWPSDTCCVLGLVFIPLCVQLRYISERMLLAAHYLLVCKDQHSCCKMSDTYAVNTSVAVNKQPFSGLPADIRSIVRYPKPPNSINFTISFTYFIVTHRNAR